MLLFSFIKTNAVQYGDYEVKNCSMKYKNVSTVLQNLQATVKILNETTSPHYCETWNVLTSE